MRDLASIIKELRATKGTQIAVADRLKKAGLKITSQQLGKYESGHYKPKADFYATWKEVYGEDILEIQKGKDQRNVSHETEKPTPDREPAIKKKDPEEYIRILITNIDRMGELNEYLLKRVKELGG